MSVADYVRQSIIEWEALCELVSLPAPRAAGAVRHDQQRRPPPPDREEEPSDEALQFVMVSSLWHF